MSLSTHIHTLTAPHLTSAPLGIERESALIVQLEAAIGWGHDPESGL